MEDHYHLTVHLSKEEYHELNEMARIVFSREFKGMTITIEPDGMERFSETLKSHFMKLLATVRRLQ